ncbi:MAG: ATP-dependent DNA helicase [Candidatus Fermentibacter sp.]|nr:ATP-dependent DNA helicase [Candidatus Fermentibacter sp.]
MEGLEEAVAGFFDHGLEGGSAGRFGRRPRQTAMALIVSRSIEDGGRYILEAGTGVGKSLAYLVPSMLSGRRTMISTATLTLQDQLFLRDIPDVAGLLSIPAGTALLKGRGNYLCLRKWRSMPPSEIPADLGEWPEETLSGDFSELPGEPDPAALSRVRSDSLDCLGPSCPARAGCFLMKARAEARRADILVVNHHLLVSASQGEDILPDSDVLIVDEAHRLEDAAAECMGLTLSAGMMMPVIDGIAWSDSPLTEKAGWLSSARIVTSLMEGLLGRPAETAHWIPEEHREDLEAVSSEASSLGASMAGAEGLAGPSAACRKIAATCDSLLAASIDENSIFLEAEGGRPRIRAVPLDPGRLIESEVFSRFRVVIATSATLSVGGSFDYMASRLGLGERDGECDFGSPFDYADQAVITCPPGLPHPDEHGALAGEAWRWGSDLASILGGRTMLLFTSNRNLQLAASAARGSLPPGVRMLVQGEASRRAILESFRSDPGAVIFGTSSFWEGIDLPGDMLQAVVIDRLPFPSPGHPWTASRMKAMEEDGSSSFMGLMLPSAVIRLRQGVGRLIRSSRDRGVVVILDRRLSSSSYGRLIMRSLPAFRGVAPDEALAFARSIAGADRG